VVIGIVHKRVCTWNCKANDYTCGSSEI